MTKSLAELVVLVKQLRDEVGHQRNEISHLKKLIENCAGCKTQQQRPEPLRASCDSHNPCYPGESEFKTFSIDSTNRNASKSVRSLTIIK